MDDRVIGSLIKKIRKSKRLSQSEVCQNFISRAALSRIESGQTTPNYRSFSHILNILDVSFDEFEYLSETTDLKKQILIDFWKITDNMQVDKLRLVINDCKTYLKINDDKLINDIFILASTLITLPNLSLEKDDTFFGKSDINKVWERINSMDSWTLNELRIAGCSLFYYPIDTALCIAKRVEKELQRYEGLENVQPIIVGLYINLTTLYLNTDNFDSAIISNKKSLNLSKRINRFDYHFLCEVREGILSGDKDKIDDGLHFLKRIKKHKIVKSLEEEALFFCKST
ncbi:helix-turn-helix transcriptional regulator [Enterococcus plantarum]|uniref:helix-turn-helix domain-containing protein n=1 Tax=Enterococcus plantarum TaxID=1077675 RepID=UPI001A8E3E8E|nr:helix-turn-helix transcriptional regulator [Enterococcus plantarum]MBO0468531.1 helix-turn-helix transcriptional regulator [Enterococcus plantarum]